MDEWMKQPADPLGPEKPQQPAPLKRGQSAQAQRDLRSKAALKANMARRKAQVLGKAQVRGRETEAADQGSPEDE
jgi:hypothetical protein